MSGRLDHIIVGVLIAGAIAITGCGGGGGDGGGSANQLTAAIDLPATDKKVAVGIPLTFTATVTGGIEPVTISWDFGYGGFSSSSEDPGRVPFPAVGEFTVMLTVSDAEGTTLSDMRTITTFGDGVSGAYVFARSVPDAPPGSMLLLAKPVPKPAPDSVVVECPVLDCT